MSLLWKLMGRILLNYHIKKKHMPLMILILFCLIAISAKPSLIWVILILILFSSIATKSTGTQCSNVGARSNASSQTISDVRKSTARYSYHHNHHDHHHYHQSLLILKWYSWRNQIISVLVILPKSRLGCWTGLLMPFAAHLGINVWQISVYNQEKILTADKYACKYLCDRSQQS